MLALISTLTTSKNPELLANMREVICISYEWREQLCDPFIFVEIIINEFDLSLTGLARLGSDSSAHPHIHPSSSHSQCSRMLVLDHAYVNACSHTIIIIIIIIKGLGLIPTEVLLTSAPATNSALTTSRCPFILAKQMGGNVPSPPYRMGQWNVRVQSVK